MDKNYNNPDVINDFNLKKIPKIFKSSEKYVKKFEYFFINECVQ